jgi:hypothetical protein
MAELHSPAISFFSFIINLMRYTEKVYSSSLFACASLRKIPFYLEGQAAGLCCRPFLFYTISLVRRSFRSAFRSAVQPFVQLFSLSFSRISVRSRSDGFLGQAKRTSS